MKKQFLNTLKKAPWLPVSLILLVIIFFAIRLIITYDGAHYLNYVAILENQLPASSWDIVRGPVFPSLIYLFDIFFGKTSAGILIGAFIFYIIFSISCYKTCQEICQEYKHRKLIQNLLLAVLILNPLILGYFHVLLTEFVAITFTMLNIIMAYRWLKCDTNNKKALIAYSLFFIFSITFCYNLKQPYIIISFIPPFIAAILSIIKKHSLKNILYRVSALILSIIVLFSSIALWNFTLNKMQVNMDTGRDSSSLLNRELLKAYQIKHDEDGDGETDVLPFQDVLGVLSKNFTSNPSHMIGVYVNNYCGLISVCEINSPNGVDYSSSSTFAGIETYENTSIGYRPYEAYSNIFTMPNHLYKNAAVYGESSDRSFIAYAMNIFEKPTNILYKLANALCFITLIVLIIVKIKTKDSKYNNLFSLSLILLSTAFLHLAISASLGLMIDRYSVEVFVPSMLGIIGTITYIKLTISKSFVKRKNKTKQQKTHRKNKITV